MLLLISTPFKSTLDICGQHTQTDWQLSDNEDFTTILWESLDDTNNLTRIISDLPVIGSIFARVRHKSYLCTSEWSQAAVITIDIEINPDLSGMYAGVNDPYVIMIDDSVIAVVINGVYQYISIPTIETSMILGGNSSPIEAVYENDFFIDVNTLLADIAVSDILAFVNNSNYITGSNIDTQVDSNTIINNVIYNGVDSTAVFNNSIVSPDSFFNGSQIYNGVSDSLDGNMLTSKTKVVLTGQQLTGQFTGMTNNPINNSVSLD